MDDLNGAKLEEYVLNSDTCQFYKDKTLFITGVTGFCGKVFFEKIARVLLPIKRVYVLIRKKKDLSSQDRLNELLNSRIFTFHQYSENQLNKFVAIDGDCSQIDLGLSECDKQILKNEVNFVFHCAASVRFDAPVPYNFKQNTLGSKFMVDLIKQFDHLENFIYVSTAFVNCQMIDDIKDEIMDFQEDIDLIIEKLSNAKTDDEMEEIAKPYFNGRPNSYILTKALAESYVKKHCLIDDENNNKNVKEFNEQNLIENDNELDLLRDKSIEQKKSSKKFRTYVVRPSIVYNSKSEPTEGWIDSFNGPSGFSIFIFIGLIRYVQMSFNNIFQCVPVDYLANVLISIPYLYTIDQDSIEVKKIEVITITYDEVTTYEIFKKGFKWLQKYPSLYMLRAPILPPMIEPKNTLLLRFKRYIFEDLWSKLMDLILLILGLSNRISIVRLHKKYQNACKLMNYFVNNHFVFPTNNYKKLVKLQNNLDAILFDFNFQNYDTDQIAYTYILGTRKYLLKEPDSTISLAAKKFKVQQFISTFFTFAYGILFTYFIVYLFRLVMNV